MTRPWLAWWTCRKPCDDYGRPAFTWTPHWCSFCLIGTPNGLAARPQLNGGVPAHSGVSRPRSQERWCFGTRSSRSFLCSSMASPCHSSFPTTSAKLYLDPLGCGVLPTTRTSSTAPAGSSTGTSSRNRPSGPTSPLVFTTCIGRSPHARGDNFSSSHLMSGNVGSPPRAWGQRHRGCPVNRIIRFTPTRVGTTRCFNREPPSNSVHPHARGDNINFRPGKIERGGSPPRAWGQHRPFAVDSRSGRFTPTRVGTTWSASLPRLPRAVHPHARGDNSLAATWRAAGTGSPPRAWGQPSLARRVCAGLRFTPTRVGTTPQKPAGRLVCTVHPHARGDNM